MLKHPKPAKPEPRQPPPLDAGFEAALVQLLECNDRETLIVSGRRLLDVLAPGAQIALDTPVAGGTSVLDGNTLTLPLGDASRHALKIDLPTGLSQAEFERRISLVARLLGAKDDQLRSLRHLRDSVRRLERAERLQRALYTITEQASSERDVPDVMRAMHQIIGSLMYAENFYIVLYDDKSGTVRFPYFVDTVDPDPPPPDLDMPMSEIYHTATWYLIHAAKPLMGPLESLCKQIDGPLINSGPACVDWLGVPLMDSGAGKAVGALVVQSYREDARYTAQDRALLTYVAQHVRTTLERHRAHAELSARVTERTRALTEANRVLQQQVMERQRGERLQAALFRIAELANSNETPEDFYAAVHRVVGGLLYARNFYIALLSGDRKQLEFPYSVDEFDANRSPRQRGSGLTEYVLEHGTALLADSDVIERMQQQRLVTPSGTSSLCWLGVPLVCNEVTVGAIVVQSYSAEHRYSTRDQELLTFVSYHIANALERKRGSDSLRLAYAELEQRVTERTHALA
ncbi:MAG TPA: GAF domain-containing protein, partial [Rhodanobacteraceae bacterium]|nr:GAF domain-containing protein [Rhodanobacteraceae bacterium]